MILWYVVSSDYLYYVSEQSAEEQDLFWNLVCGDSTRNVIFARMPPYQRYEIVRRLKKMNQIVTFVSAGVSDCQSLKSADIGIAMGITSTSVSQEASDMILINDNFTFVANGIEYSRIIFDNLQKSVVYTLSSNIAQIMPFMLNVIFGLPICLMTVIMMNLLIDFGTNLLCAISMIYENAGGSTCVMNRKPRNPNKDCLITWNMISFAYLKIGILQAMAAFYAYYIVCWSYGLKMDFLLDLGFSDNQHIFSHNDNINIKYTDDTIKRDAYFLYCFNEIFDEKCVYFPDFLQMTNDDYNDWLNNNKHDYALNSKQFLSDYVIANNTNIANISQAEFISKYLGIIDDNCYTSSLWPTRECWPYKRESTSKHWSDDNSQNDSIDYYANSIRFCANFSTMDKKYYTTQGSNSLFPMWTYDRSIIIQKAHSAYFITIVLMQSFNVIICKTRIGSIFKQGMSNCFMNYALIWQVFFGAFLIYTPVGNIVAGFSDIKFVWWTAFVPFLLMFYLYQCVIHCWIKHKHAQAESQMNF